MRISLIKQVAAGVAAVGLSVPIAAQSYKITNLVSDGSIPAITTDANFLNPWAVSTSGTWWISTANIGFNYVVPSTDAIANTVSFKGDRTYREFHSRSCKSAHSI